MGGRGGNTSGAVVGSAGGVRGLPEPAEATAVEASEPILPSYRQGKGSRGRGKRKPVATCTGILTCSLSAGAASGGGQGVRGLRGARRGLQGRHHIGRGSQTKDLTCLASLPLTKLTLLMTGS